MSHTFRVELTDTFGGDANYSWVKRATITVPELTHFGHNGSTNYSKANKAQRRQVMTKAKAAVGLTGVKGRVDDHGDSYTFRPYGLLQVMFISFDYE